MTTSTAISAQGTTLEISTGTGGAVSTTSGAAGYPTILTKASHGLTAGTVVTLAAFTGTDAATLNGQIVPVLYVTTDTYAVGVDTTGKTITYTTGTATPVTYTKIANVKSFVPPDAKAASIDKTHLGSTVKEYAKGLIDNNMVTCTVDLDNTDAGQLACRTSLAATAALAGRNWKVTLSDATVASFSGFVDAFGGGGGGVDAIVTSNLSIRVTSAVTWA